MYFAQKKFDLKNLENDLGNCCVGCHVYNIYLYLRNCHKYCQTFINLTVRTYKSLFVIMVNYTNAEMADMHFVYGLANGNSYEARRIYQQRYPRRLVPCAETFSNIHRRLAETGTFKRNRNTPGKPQTVRTPELEEAVLQIIDEHPETSTRKIGVTVNASHQTILRILHDQQLYLFHIQKVQDPHPRDFPQRLVLCDWFRQKIA